MKEQTFYCFLLFLLSFKSIKLLTQHCFTTNIDVLSNFDYLKLISLFSEQNCPNQNNHFSIIPTIHSFYCVFEFFLLKTFMPRKSFAALIELRCVLVIANFQEMCRNMYSKFPASDNKASAADILE